MSARGFAWFRRLGALMPLLLMVLIVHAPPAWAGASTTTLASSANPSTNGQSVTFTATVKGTSPTGTVTFKDGTTTLGTGTVSGTGNTRTATFATAALAVGTHSITAAYGGDGGNTASTSAALTQTVNKSSTTTTVTSSANPSTTSQSVTFTATVTGISPTGTVTFKDGTTTLGTGTLAGTGNSRTATFAISTLSIASHSITAAYAGDSGNNTSTSTALAQVVNKAVTTTSVASSLNPSTTGQSVTFTATVTGVNPTGTVTFKDGATTLGTGALSGTGNSRTATFASSTLSVASHSITASYGGDASNGLSTSSTLTQTVVNATTTAIASSVNPSTAGQSVTFTATVTGLSPSGTVTFKDGTTTLGTGTLTGTGNSRTATFVTSTLSVSSHSITASYGGDASNAVSNSSALTQVVNGASTTTSVASSANPSANGASVTFTATVTGVNPTGTVTFKDGTTTLGTGALAGTGNTRTATYVTAALSIATHSITAAYGGDAGNGASTSAALSQVINATATTTTLSASTTTTTVGQNITLTASVTGSAPTGTVTFKDGATTIGTGTLSAGSATLAASFSTAGAHSLTAVYGGDASNASGTSAAVSVTVNASTDPDLAISNLAIGAIVVNQSGTWDIPVSFTVTNVGAGPAQPTWYDRCYLSSDAVASTNDVEMTYVGRNTVLNPGASYNVSTVCQAAASNAPGNYTVFAVVDGNANPLSAGSLVEPNRSNNTAAAAVTLARPDLAISNLAIGTIVANQNDTWTIPVSFTVSNLGTVPAQPNWYDRCWLSSDAVISSNDGEMTYSGHNTALAAGASYNVSMNCTTAVVPAGSYTVFVRADGNLPTDNGSVVEANENNNLASAPVTLITPTGSSIALSSSVNPVIINQNTVLTATLTPGTATGTVTFKDGGTAIGTANIAAGVATLSTNFTIVSTRSLTAVYSGDTYSWPSTSPALSQVVGGAPSGATLSATPVQALVSQAVSLSVTVSGLGPTGTVTFKDNGTTIGTSAVSSGIATLFASFTTPGVHSLTATYSGDTNNLTSTSNTLNVDIYAESIPTGPMTWGYGYDANGNARYSKDPNGNITDRDFDSLNRVAVIRQPAPGVGGTRPTISYGYDGRGQVTSVTDPRNLVTSYTVNGLGNTSSTASPDSGTTNATFDAAGNVVTRTDARGKTATYGYDSLNRLTSISYPTGTPTTFEYDGGAVPVANSIGKLTRITDESGTTTTTHDGFGRVATKTQVVGSGPGAKTFSVAYTWGTSGAANGKLIAITYPSGSRINIGYDSAGRIASLSLNPANANGSGTNTGTTVPLLSGAAYNGANDLLGWSWGDANAYQRSFDAHGRLKTYPLAGTQRTLAYDNALGITGFTHTQGGNAQPALDQSFSYDALDRLVSANVAGSSAGYGYDATGNRTSRVIGASSYANAIAANSNRLASVQSPGQSGTVTNTYVHDNAGNLTSDGNASYAYSDRGRMVSATVAAGSVSYLVNGLEQRVMKTGPTSLVATGAMYYVHDEQGRLLGQYDANLTPLHETVYFGDTPVAELKTSGSAASSTLQVNPHYIYADQINTPRVITRASDQAIVWRWDQAEAFGAAPPMDNPSGFGAFTFDQRFPGQVFDAETGNHDNWHRTYQAGVGRYVQSDPIGLEGGINTYAYALAKPLSLIDATGLLTWRCKATNSTGVGYDGDYKLCDYDCFARCGDATISTTIRARGWRSGSGSHCYGQRVITQTNRQGTLSDNPIGEPQGFNVETGGILGLVDMAQYNRALVNGLRAAERTEASCCK